MIPPSDGELEAWASEFTSSEDHFKIPRLIAEVRRLRARPPEATEEMVDAAQVVLKQYGLTDGQRTAARLAINAAFRLACLPSHRHVKRGSDYHLIGYAKFQSDTWLVSAEMAWTPGSAVGWVDRTLADKRDVAVYLALGDGTLCVRPLSEFADGRFQALTAMEKP